MLGFVKKGNEYYAGKHVLVDAWGCDSSLEPEYILDIMRRAAEATGATILFSHAHTFEPEGSSGVVILAESHISFHFWPSAQGYMAIDIFVCGDCDPMQAIPVFESYLKPEKMTIKMEYRGHISINEQVI